MKTKLVCLMALCLTVLCSPSKAETVQSSFWGCSFGMTDSQVKDNLVKAKFEPMVASASMMLVKNGEIAGISYEKVAFMFSPADGSFYKLIGSNTFSSKEKADSCYNAAMSMLRDAYPKLQVIRHPDTCLKMCTYLDDDNVFYLGLFASKDNTKYFVNINFWNKLLQKKMSNQ